MGDTHAAVVRLEARIEELAQRNHVRPGDLGRLVISINSAHELEVLRKEFGPFTEDQDETLTTLTIHITQRIAGSLARELKELPEREEQDVLTAAVGRLFQLEQPVGAGKN